MYLIHEFTADEKAVHHADTETFAKMLLTAQFKKFDFFPAQSIFYSPVKRRLIMLTTSKKPQFSYLRRLMILPLTAAIVCLFSFTVNNKKAVPSIQKISAAKPFVLVVDAGHGGKDDGAIANDLYEKDVVLKIAEKIKSLSSQYGVDVILTRNSDIFMDPKQKSEFANAQNAGAFISIHTNAQLDKKTDSSGMEIYIDKESIHATENAILASAIMQSLQQNFKTPDVLNYRNIGIWVIKNSTIPAALIECGYLTNKGDANILKQDNKIELIAKNILQGVAIYANNSFDKSQMYKLQNRNADTSLPPVATDTTSSINKNFKSKTPLYIVNGKETDLKNIHNIKPETISSIDVLQGEAAIKIFGEKGKDGVVEIKLKKANAPLNPPPSPLQPLPPTPAPAVQTEKG